MRNVIDEPDSKVDKAYFAKEAQERRETAEKTSIEREKNEFKMNASEAIRYNKANPVFAVRSGEITKSGFTLSGAFRIGVDTQDGYRDNYIHLNPTSGMSAPKGSIADEGSIIGFMANPTNGRTSTSPHIHFERINDSDATLSVHPGCESPLGANSRETFYYHDFDSSSITGYHEGIDYISY